MNMKQDRTAIFFDALIALVQNKDKEIKQVNTLNDIANDTLDAVNKIMDKQEEEIDSLKQNNRSLASKLDDAIDIANNNYDLARGKGTRMNVRVVPQP